MNEDKKRKTTPRTVSLAPEVDTKLQELIDLSYLDRSAVITILIQKADPADFAGFAPERVRAERQTK